MWYPGRIPDRQGKDGGLPAAGSISPDVAPRSSEGINPYPSLDGRGYQVRIRYVDVAPETGMNRTEMMSAVGDIVQKDNTAARAGSAHRNLFPGIQRYIHQSTIRQNTGKTHHQDDDAHYSFLFKI